MTRIKRVSAPHSRRIISFSSPMLEGGHYPPIIDVKAESHRGYVTCPNHIANKWWGQDLNLCFHLLPPPLSDIVLPSDQNCESWLQIPLPSLHVWSSEQVT